MMSKDLTMVQLERLLERKRSKLDGLLKRRERLQKQLATVEGRIGTIGGIVRDGSGRRKVRRRPKNDQPLIVVVTDVLTKHPKGLTLKELAAAVLATGYKTFSDKFENTLYQCLYHNMKRLVHDANTHTYRLRKTASPKRAARPKAAEKEPKVESAG
jgi:hypothetical protein